ncbi:Transcriptional regulatory protein, C terminal [Serratia ficaria]|uniref:winged helix-turn-helix domain-containing protein n=1 Tax=Serratia ficaria TaxID=61651 RepID=UPI00217BC514|nr:helix-turn-helix domain-containing protein [Serratia ficaria]CAI1710675.1 Transcriptional regulatory protein, C terminal [Serratia ficaria]
MDENISLSEAVFYNPAHSSLEMVSGAESIHLTPNEKKLLEIVLENRGRKETIIDEIWTRQGIVVSESSYHQLVKMLRRKFHEASLPPLALKTIPRYGIVLVTGKKEGDVAETEDEAEAQNEEPVIGMPDKALASALGRELQQQEGDAAAEPEVIGHSVPPLGVALTARCPVWLFAVLAAVMIFAPALWVYVQNDSALFSHRLIKDDVTYHATSSTYFGKGMMTRVARDLDSVTKEVYISGNGPKVWVAYCQNKLDKENARCAYTHFSAY